MSGNTTLIIILLVVIGFGVILYVGLAGFGWISPDHTASPADAANKFLTNIAQDWRQSAYDLTSQDYRKQRSLEQFRQSLDMPSLLLMKYTLQETGKTAGGVMYRASINTLDGQTLTADMTVVEENGQWRVDQFVVR